MLKTWVNDNKKDLIFIVLCWFIISIVMFTRNWDSISNLNLKDNDDYMRYVQFTDWIKYGNWYLEPMARFNPEDGVIMHWSRVPDLLLAGTTLVLSSFFDITTASLIAIGIVPLFYLLCFALAVFALVDHYVGEKYRFIGMVFALGSHAITKFFPGAIDHHNLQLIIVALFLSLTPINARQTTESVRWFAQGILISISLWIGLDNFFFFVFYLGTYSAYCLLYNNDWFKYFYKLCFISVFFSLIFIILNRPINEVFTIHYDSLSIPFVTCFLCGGILLFLLEKLIHNQQTYTYKLLIAISISLVVFIPVMIIFPELAKGAYADYPEVVKTYWLDNVSEAQSMYSLIMTNGFFSTENYFLFFIPSLLYIVLKNKKTHLNILYIIFTLNLFVALFWQIRAITLCFVLSAPIQIYVLFEISEKVKNKLFSTLIISSGIPIFVLIYISILTPIIGNTTNNSDTQNNNDYTNNIESVFNESNISNRKVLSGIESGTKILSKTNNSILAAPYHRNINGNNLAINTFLESDEDVIKDTLKNNNIDYILINNDNHLKVLARLTEDGALIKRLKSYDIPEYLELINAKNIDDYQLFKFKG
ncbi:hypothetical protein VHA01S_055_00270 [Vibrio halioticoli NBRC 102217]|uniref:Glycosyltransferase RgtA/B/C/D-like domain-containing protein n=1 Tax=Vibrio halioticoli NBRC 102217 TaxID=1219072 RepID=V5HNG4_9VIBR|nr:hypothetical protein [Vibrio halioticoli]GAD90770.1 hypothetical protein VHA01S_055_00270 [Vibrio halioticoli NBRC 102217]